MLIFLIRLTQKNNPAGHLFDWVLSPQPPRRPCGYHAHLPLKWPKKSHREVRIMPWISHTQSINNSLLMIHANSDLNWSQNFWVIAKKRMLTHGHDTGGWGVQARNFWKLFFKITVDPKHGYRNPQTAQTKPAPNLKQTPKFKWNCKCHLPSATPYQAFCIIFYLDSNNFVISQSVCRL